MIPILTVPEKRWACPSCGKLAVTREAQPHTEFHHCPALGITAPMVELHGAELDLRAARHVVVEREDYVGDEDVTLSDSGRPVMAVDLERADGSNDRAVFAGAAHASVSL